MKTLVKIIALAMVCALSLPMLVACYDGVQEWERHAKYDNDSTKYRDYYQLCVYSFADSNGDGMGDFRGIQDKLQYIKDLGFEGIWLSPIHPAMSYHGYNVIDYYQVNSQYGDMTDFDNMVAKAHELGLYIMLDMVFNHTASSNGLFKQFRTAVLSGDTTSKYYDYYSKSNSPIQGYSKLNDNILGDKDPNGVSWYVEARFDSSMPELNLSNPDVKSEIYDIMEFWLNDRQVDAFRLDAVKEYYNSNTGANVEFLNWLAQASETIKSGSYMVGEAWINNLVGYYNSDLDSYFNFAMSNSDGSLYATATIKRDAQEYANKVIDNQQNLGNKVDALFSCNHDTGRLANTSLSYFSRGEYNESGLDKYKFGTALLYTMSGNLFHYYGSELGMRSGIEGSGEDSGDPTKRMAMNWDNDNAIKATAGNLTDCGNFAYKCYSLPFGIVIGTFGDKFGSYDLLGGENIGDSDLGGVAQQQNNDDSLLTYHRRMMLLRRQNIELVRGVSKIEYSDKDLAIISKTYNNSTILVIYNFSVLNAKIDLSQYDCADYDALAGWLAVNNSEQVRLKGDRLSLPSYGIAILR